MKRIFFIASLACLVSFSSFAGETSVTDVLSSFYKTFHNVQNVNWTEVDGMIRIGFTTNGQEQYAYYSEDKLIVVALAIQIEDLPQSLKDQLAEYRSYTISQIYILSQNKSKEYCVVLDSSARHIVLKGKNKWKIYLEEKK